MREVYRSLRLEQVEGAGEMLRQADIEVSIMNGRSYKGGRRRNFSFREAPDSPRAVLLFVTHNGDLPLARKLLREAGLMEPSKRESYLSGELKFVAQDESKKLWTTKRLRTVLLGLVALFIILFTVFGPRLR